MNSSEERYTKNLENEMHCWRSASMAIMEEIKNIAEKCSSTSEKKELA